MNQYTLPKIYWKRSFWLQDTIIRKAQAFDITGNKERYIQIFTQDHFTGSVLPTRKEIKLIITIVKYTIAWPVEVSFWMQWSR